MGVRRGSLTFTRFFVQGDPPRDLRKRYLEAVRLRKFTPLAPEDEASEAVGWCVMERPFDLDFEPDKLFYDRYVQVGFRVDKWRIPGSLLRSHVADEEQRMLSRAGREKLTKAEREDVKLRVIARLRRKILPTSRAFDVLWDLDRGTVLLFTHAARTAAEFTALFEKSFGLALVQDSPYTAAHRADLPASVLRQLDRVEPTSFVAGRRKLASPGAAAEAARPAAAEVPRASSSEEASDDDEDRALIERIETTRFLGAEYLLWLWLRVELGGEHVDAGELGAAECWLERKLVFEHILDQAERVTVRGAQPTGSAEAREAVRAMKMPVSSRVVLRAADQDFSWDFSGPKFLIGSGKIPAVMGDEGDDEHLERLALIERLTSVSDALFTAFLRVRLTPVWAEAWQPAIVAWAEGAAIPTAALKAIAAAQPAKRARAAGSRKSAD